MIFKLGLVTRANAEELVQLVAATTRYATEMRFFFSCCTRTPHGAASDTHTQTYTEHTHTQICCE